MKNKHQLLVLAAAALAAAQACAADTIKIGFISSLSGPVAALGVPYEKGIRAAYQKANGAAPTDAFSAYSFDGWLLMLDAASRAKGEPGTPAYRVALRDAIVSTKELVGTHSVYNFKPTDRYGSDDRSRVIVKLEKGQWKLVK